MENLVTLNRYPTKSSSYVIRPVPSSQISFATGTKFNNKYEKRLSDMIKKSTYNLKPIKMEKDAITRYRAPAATVPVSGSYQSVMRSDYKYPSSGVMKAMNPQPKWIYRSRSDLGVGRLFDHDYQYFNNGRYSATAEEINETRSGTQMSKSRHESDIGSRNDDIGSRNGDIGSRNGDIVSRNNSRASISKGRASVTKSVGFIENDTGVPSVSKEFSESEESENVYAFYKPLVGDSRDRYIENAYMKRAAEGTVFPLKLDSSSINFDKRQYYPRQMRFTDTFNKVYEPRPDKIAKIPPKLPGLYKNNTSFDINGGKSGPNVPNVTQGNQQNARQSLYQKAPVAQSLGNDMIRTYEKQARLKEMINK